MDRIALAKRLESLSSVFASHTPYNRDLRAMSYVLSKMADDKFTSILSGDFSPDELEACMYGGGQGPMTRIPVGDPVDEPEGLPGGEPKVIVIEKEEGVPMSAEANEKTAGMFWCKEASKAVVDNLLRDVVGMNKSQCCSTGAKLEAKQVPNGSHDGEKASTLKPDQTPDDAASIKTNMVEKSHGAVKKEAGSIKGPGVPDGTGPHSGTPKCQMNEKKDEEKEASLEDIKKAKKEKEEKKMKDDVEKLKKEKAEKKASEKGEDEKAEEKAEDKEEKAIKMLNEAEKEEDKAEEGEKDATTESSSSSFEGIELVASMEEVELDAAEADKLSKLFE